MAAAANDSRGVTTRCPKCGRLSPRVRAHSYGLRCLLTRPQNSPSTSTDFALRNQILPFLLSRRCGVCGAMCPAQSHWSLSSLYPSSQCLLKPFHRCHASSPDVGQVPEEPPLPYAIAFQEVLGAPRLRITEAVDHIIEGHPQRELAQKSSIVASA